MGSSPSTSRRNTIAFSSEIDRMLVAERLKERSIVKLLLLGTGQSGKTTFLKQMRILHNYGFTDDEIMLQRPVIWCNLLEIVKTIIDAAETLEIQQGNTTPETELEMLTNLSSVRQHDLTAEDMMAVAPLVLRLRESTLVQECYLRASEMQLHDSAKYFIDSAHRLCQLEYIPTQQDILRCRVATTGINELQFTDGKHMKTLFRVVDVGGQRTERKKWLHCFDNVNALIYVVAISEYDQTMWENSRRKRIHDSLLQFRKTINSVWFKDTCIVLFLNKKDIFEEKIRQKPITCAFEEYKGPQEYEESRAYIQNQFISRNKNPKKTIYRHFTCATDTDQVRVLLDASFSIILQHKLKAGGLA